MSNELVVQWRNPDGRLFEQYEEGGEWFPVPFDDEDEDEYAQGGDSK